MPGTCIYQMAWEKDYPWVSSVRTDTQSAYCGISLKSFKINNSGVGQLKEPFKVPQEWKEQRNCF